MRTNTGDPRRRRLLAGWVFAAAAALGGGVTAAAADDAANRIDAETATTYAWEGVFDLTAAQLKQGEAHDLRGSMEMYGPHHGRTGSHYIRAEAKIGEYNPPPPRPPNHAQQQSSSTSWYDTQRLLLFDLDITHVDGIVTDGSTVGSFDTYRHYSDGSVELLQSSRVSMISGSVFPDGRLVSLQIDGENGEGSNLMFTRPA